jgi:hypothetical protein
MADELTLDGAIEEYEAVFGDAPRFVLEGKGFEYEKAIRLLEAVEAGKPIEDLDNIDDLSL